MNFDMDKSVTHKDSISFVHVYWLPIPLLSRISEEDEYDKILRPSDI